MECLVFPGRAFILFETSSAEFIKVDKMRHENFSGLMIGKRKVKQNGRMVESRFPKMIMNYMPIEGASISYVTR